MRREACADLVADDARDASASGLRQCLEPCGDINGVAVDVIAVDDHVAEIEADPEGDPPFFGLSSVASDYPTLGLHSATDCIHDTRKFCQHAIAGGFKNAPVMLLNFRVNEFAAMRLETVERALLVGTHQARISCYIGDKYRGQTPDRSHSLGAQVSSIQLIVPQGRDMA
jgi:hypothetical protein